MAPMNLPTKQRQPHRHRDQTCGCQGRGGGSGMDGSLGLVDANYFHLEWVTHEVLLTAQGTISNLLG